MNSNIYAYNIYAYKNKTLKHYYNHKYNCLWFGKVNVLCL